MGYHQLPTSTWTVDTFAFLNPCLFLNKVMTLVAVRFDLTGDYLGKYPGWYNWPVDMTLGPNNQVRRGGGVDLHPNK